MAKWYGKLGFVVTEENPAGSGIWIEHAVEKNYRGDLMQQSYTWTQREKSTGDLTMNNRISIVADDFAMTNLGYMRYAIVNGVAWKINSAELLRPRIELTFGGVYNGQQAQSATSP